jgi:hypothetical protein
MNKYFNQVGLSNSWISEASGYRGNRSLRYAADVAIRAFHAVCSVFGSFEKSALFGRSNKIANINGSTAFKDFEQNQLFLQNIRPFLISQKATSENSALDEWQGIPYAYTGHLYTHPLKQILWEVFNSLPAQPSIHVQQLDQIKANNHKLNTIDSESKFLIRRDFTAIAEEELQHYSQNRINISKKTNLSKFLSVLNLRNI